MVRSLLPLAALALLACSKTGSGSTPLASADAGASEAPPEAASPSPGAPVARSPAVEACVDRWLAEHQLNAYGDPQGTVYAGGTPLFDEATGRQTDRLERVFARHPAARARCLGEGADAGARSQRKMRE